VRELRNLGMKTEDQRSKTVDLGLIWRTALDSSRCGLLGSNKELAFTVDQVDPTILNLVLPEHSAHQHSMSYLWPMVAWSTDFCHHLWFPISLTHFLVIAFSIDANYFF